MGCMVYCRCIGVEIREAGFAVVTETEISNCGSQGLTGHAGALGYALYRLVVSVEFSNKISNFNWSHYCFKLTLHKCFQTQIDRV